MSAKLEYLLTATRKLISGEGRACPNCGSAAGEVVDRKYLVTSLARCAACRLLFRIPTTTDEENVRFYQSQYTQGFTTDLPSDEQLAEYIRTDFRHPEKTYQPYIDLVLAACSKPGARLFEFGCSWGYGSFQFAKAGFQVEAFEISRPRGGFAAQKLGVHVHPTLDTVTGPYDVFFSSHVLEHVPSVQRVIDLAFRTLVPGGIFMAVTPNGSDAFRQADFSSWHKLWGKVHPNFLDAEFYRTALKSHSPYLASAPYDLEDIRRWSDGGAQTSSKLDGGELLVMARR